MGTVYEAIQEHPRRTVALKVMKHGIASRSALRRFEYESQILARLRHPGIAQVYEAGTHRDDSGTVPYFAMEYLVGARPITKYAKEKKLGTRERLKLFASVCDAVHHGHQKGIIHRDLKPNNILVDAQGQVKIIDFGVARATDSDLAVTTLQTNIGQLIGTLQYMSPEQCEADPHNIDTRSDVYALGVVFYELLCDRLPYDVTRVAMHEATRIIREEQPTKLTTLNKTLRRDIETIALKALEKDRERRYQSATDFRQDIQRYLSNEAITARPPSIVYQFQIFARRNKGLLGALVAAVVFVVFVPASIFSTSQYMRAEAARAKAVVARDEAVAAREGEAQQRRLANKAKEQAEIERDKAREAEQLALSTQHKLQEQAYLANIFAAGAAMLTNELATVRRRLNAAPPEFRNWEWDYLDMEAQAKPGLATLLGHEGSVMSVAFSPDGTRLASGSRDETVRLWHLFTEEEDVVLRGHIGGVTSVAFSPDGARLASGSSDKTVRLWDTANGETVAILRGHKHFVLSVAFSPDGTRVASGSADMTLRVWDASTGKELAALRGHEDSVESVAFSPDGTRLVSADHKAVRVWDASSGKELAVDSGHEGYVLCAVFSPDGARVASGSGSAVRIWDWRSGNELRVWRGNWSEVYHVAFSPDGTYVAAALSDGTVRLWDVESGETLSTLRGHAGKVLSVAFSPGATLMASGSADMGIRIWDWAAGKPLRILIPDCGPVLSIALAPDGERLASGSHDGTVHLWDPATGEDLIARRRFEAVNRPKRFPWMHLDRLGQESVASVEFSSDGTLLVAASMAGTVHIWDARTAEELHVLESGVSVYSVSFSPDGTQLASAAGDGTVHLWDVGTGELVAALKGHTRSALSVAFSPDGTRLASSSADSTVRIWALSTAKEMATLEGHTDFVYFVAFNPDGTRLASASRDRTVRVWDTGSGATVAILKHPGPVSAVTFSADGARLATGCSDKTVRVWDTLAYDQLIVLQAHQSSVESVVFSADGTRLMSASRDGAIHIWHTVPYWKRLKDRHAILGAAIHAERIVDDLWGRLNDWKSVTQRLYVDASLTGPLRRAALNDVLRRAARRSEN